jgi:5-aminolevulinate synthase
MNSINPTNAMGATHIRRTATATDTPYHDALAKRVQDLQSEGNYRTFLTLQKSAARFPEVEFFESANGGTNNSTNDRTRTPRRAINWCSNDYLNMSISPVVIERTQKVVAESGLGSGGTRNIAGTTLHHAHLEERLARLHGKQSALVFNSAFLANQTTLATLGAAFENVVFLSDERNHASIIAGIQASKRRTYIFRHNSTEHLETLLSSLPHQQPKIIVCESVYSINGSIAPLQAFTALAKRYNALLYVDEVHGVGVYGQQAGGVAEQLGCSDGIHIINGTLAKAFGTFGGYIAADAALVEFVRSFAPGFIFTTSLPPALCAASVASIDHLAAAGHLRTDYCQHVQRLRATLRRYGVPAQETPSHITPVVLGSTQRCKAVSARLLHEFGIYVQPINYPTVKRGEECLRLTITLRHSQEQMEELARALAAVLEQPSQQNLAQGSVHNSAHNSVHNSSQRSVQRSVQRSQNKQKDLHLASGTDHANDLLAGAALEKLVQYS